MEIQARHLRQHDVVLSLEQTYMITNVIHSMYGDRTVTLFAATGEKDTLDYDTLVVISQNR